MINNTIRESFFPSKDIMKENEDNDIMVLLIIFYNRSFLSYLGITNALTVEKRLIDFKIKILDCVGDSSMVF